MTATKSAADKPAGPGASPMSLRKNFSWTLVGNTIYWGCQWAIVVMLAKLGTTEMVGLFSLGLAISAPVAYFCNLQLRGVLATDSKQEHPFGLYLALRLIMTAVLLLVMVAIVVGGRYESDKLWAVMLVGVAKAVEGLCDMFYGLQQQFEHMDRIAWSLIARGVSGLVLAAGALLWTGKLTWAICGLIVAWASVFLVHDVPHARRLLASQAGVGGPASRGLRPIWRLGEIRGLAWIALPIGFAGGLNLLASNVPRYMIESFLDVAALGLYAAIAYVTMASNLIVNALGQSASPRLARFYAQRRIPEFRRLLGKLILIGAGLGVCGLVVGWLVGRPVLELLYTAEYAERVDLLIWLLGILGILAAASFASYGLTATRLFRIQPPIYVVKLLAIAAAGAVLIPRFGLVGAAWSLGLATLLHLVMILATIEIALRRASRMRESDHAG